MDLEVSQHLRAEKNERTPERAGHRRLAVLALQGGDPPNEVQNDPRRRAYTPLLDCREKESDRIGSIIRLLWCPRV
jgi:hypothetical protein